MGKAGARAYGHEGAHERYGRFRAHALISSFPQPIYAAGAAWNLWRAHVSPENRALVLGPGRLANEQLSSCRREIADRFGRVKAGASRPRTTCGYGLDSAKSPRATATLRSTPSAHPFNVPPNPYPPAAFPLP